MSTTAVPALPTYPTGGDVYMAVRTAVVDLNSLITNFNTGGVTDTYLRTISIALGSDSSKVTSGIVTGAYELLTQIQSAEFILTANGTDLDNKAADVGVTRKPATAANANLAVQFTAPAPVVSTTVIPIGTIVAYLSPDPTVPPITYITTSAAIIQTGQTISSLCNVTCQQTGSVGNVQPGSINTVISGAAGMTVTNLIPISGGQPVEGDDSPNGGLRQRALDAIPNASQCTIAAIQAAAISYPGIVSAAVLDNTATDGVTFMLGEVQVYCDDGSGNLGATTTTTASLVMPAVGASVAVHVLNPVPFPENAYLQVIGSAGDQFYGQVTGVAGSVLTVLCLAVQNGLVGDTISSGATVANPNNSALTQFQTDLTVGKWRSAGVQVYAHGSVVVSMTIVVPIDINSTYASTISSPSEIQLAVQTAAYNYVNSIPIGRPVILAAIIDVAKNVAGVSNVIVDEVLINGVNADFGASGGSITIPINNTPRCLTLSAVTVTINAEVPY